MTTPGSLRYGQSVGRWVLLATVLGSAMAFIDATVVNIALPRIGTEFRASSAGLQWTVNGYTLTLASLILLGGSLGDRYGRRRIFVIGVGWFAVASLLCGVAWNVEVLIACRALQGIGGALLTPGALAILESSFDHEDRAKAIGAWSGLSGVAGAIGPFLGGWLIELGSWRLVFLINIPPAAIVILVALRYIPESADPRAPGGFDGPGVLLGAIGLAGLTYGFTAWPDSGLSSPVVLGALTAGVLGVAGFVLVERRSSRPMLPLEVFSSRVFTAANLVTFLVYMALGGVFFLVVVTLQVVAGFSPLAAGTAMLPVTVLMLLLSARSGALATRIGPRIPMTVGPIVCAGALLLLTGVGPGTRYFTGVLPAVVVFGLGLALTVAPLTSTVLAAVDDRHAGIASGVNNAVARAAGLLAVAVLPLASGLGGSGLTDPHALHPAFRMSMLLCSGLLAAGGLIAFGTIPSQTTAPEPADPEPSPCQVHCAVAGTPLHPSHTEQE